MKSPPNSNRLDDIVRVALDTDMDMSRGVPLLALEEQMDAEDAAGFATFHSSSALWCDSADRPPPSSCGAAAAHHQVEDDMMTSSLVAAPSSFTWLQQSSTHGLPLSEVEIERNISKILEEFPEISKDPLFPAADHNIVDSCKSMLAVDGTPLSSVILQLQPQPSFEISASIRKPTDLAHSLQISSYEPIPNHAPGAQYHHGLSPHSRTIVPIDHYKLVLSSSIAVDIEPEADHHPAGDSRNRAKKCTKISTADTGDDPMQKQRPSKKKPQPTMKFADCTNQTSWTRADEQAEHILRERHRRDDMTVKYSILESLLPAGSKRDRATIVEDAMKLVKDLQHRREKLLKKGSSRRKPPVVSTQPHMDIHMQEVMLQFTMPAIKHSGTGDSSSPMSLSMQESQLNESTAVKNSCVRDCFVHSDLLNEIVIEMMCKPRPNFRSTLLQAVESQNLELIRCTITKTPIGMICIIVAKLQQQDNAESPRSHASIVQALKTALQVV